MHSQLRAPCAGVCEARLTKKGTGSDRTDHITWGFLDVFGFLFKTTFKGKLWNPLFLHSMNNVFSSKYTQKLTAFFSFGPERGIHLKRHRYHYKAPKVDNFFGLIGPPWSRGLPPSWWDPPRWRSLREGCHSRDSCPRDCSGWRTLKKCVYTVSIWYCDYLGTRAK